MSWADASVAKNYGVFGWTYQRANYKYDQELRWQRYTAGRKMAIAQVGMFREDCADLAAVAISKMKNYAPSMSMGMGWCVTVFVEGRSGLKFPGPPVWISGMYLTCLGIAFSFMGLGTWFAFHCAIRAQVASCQLRTRRIRLPVPTQRQLDSARKILSSFEENSVYDMLKIPFVMPHSGHPEGHADVIEKPEGSRSDGDIGYYKGGLPGIGKKVKAKVKEGGKLAAKKPVAAAKGWRMANVSFTDGAPFWFDKEVTAQQRYAGASPNNHYAGDGDVNPHEHFEHIRQAQKEWWCAEAYSRICFVIGQMHLVQAFAYWLVIHCIAELGMVWCANICAAGLMGGVWVMYHLDILPAYGGGVPLESAGPFVAAQSLTLLYAHTPSETVIQAGRALAIFVTLMQFGWTIRLYICAKPHQTRMATHKAEEAGGRLFNESAACALPSWLPSAFQHCTYLVAPPKTPQQLKEEDAARLPAERPGDDNRLGAQVADASKEPMLQVDMTPWYYVRAMFFATFAAWLILLAGRLVEAAMGERMLVTTPGSPPWSRTGQWYGWEHGPITSKHYAHVTPEKGHWAWRKGWGPQGQQELWASDMFGFAPEADSWWAEDTGPEPRVGVAGVGENTWGQGIIAYGHNEYLYGEKEHEEEHGGGRAGGGHGGHVLMEEEAGHGGGHGGGHRRLSSKARASEVVRPVVPAAVQWPSMLEPDLLACGPAPGSVVALTASGLGAFVSSDIAAGRTAGKATNFTLQGLLELGLARGATWGNASLVLVTGSGAVASCPATHRGPAADARCSPMAVPKLPVGSVVPATVVDAGVDAPLRAAVAHVGGKISLLELDQVWHEVGDVQVPLESCEVVAISAAHSQLVAFCGSGATYRWELQAHKPVGEPQVETPSAGQGRTWRSACAMPNGKIMRLATKWRPLADGALTLQPELLL